MGNHQFQRESQYLVVGAVLLMWWRRRRIRTNFYVPLTWQRSWWRHCSQRAYEARQGFEERDSTRTLVDVRLNSCRSMALSSSVHTTLLAAARRGIAATPCQQQSGPVKSRNSFYPMRCLSEAGRVTLTTKSCNNGATTLSRMNFSRYMWLYLVQLQCSLLRAVR